ncbi:hypothetical protein [Agromyces neolithicus]|uniref:Peptidase S11 D-alanyl-D-alanine carboxypeptidase A N-terminal domain-containing protein n=1 Tax=Agromyces neolithicus TaxID=269420 RepID=A0ABN2M7M2_9MICO
MNLRPGRIIGITLGAVAILAVGVYGPAMLLGPLPEPSVHLATTSAETSEAGAAAPIVLPDEGASALALVSEDGSAAALAAAGDSDAVPIGGAVKLVTVLATLESLPLPADGDGPGLRIGPADYTDYLRYEAEGSRTLQVSPGDTWSERDVVRAVLLASSNNHADTLVRWAYGSVDAYVTAANEWLAEQGFTATRVADATGLSGDNVGTPEELTRLAALVLADPELAAIYEAPDSNTFGARNVPDVVDRLGDEGIRAIARSYTDEAGVSFIYTTTVTAAEGDEPHRVIGALTLMPDYETLDAAVVQTTQSVSAAAQPISVITAGTSYGSVESAWGDTAELIATADRTDAAWGSDPGEVSVTVERFTTAPAGRVVGRVAVTTADGDLTSELELSSGIGDPGPLWRLVNPAALISAFVAGQSS